MIRILSGEGLVAIHEAAARRALLVFDFDGTLAPIVPDRGTARMRDATCVLLRAVALAYPTAIVSGRERADVALRVARVPLVAIVGNHGAEATTRPIDARLRGRVQAWAAALLEALSDLAGIELEDKGLTLAVHYRRSPDTGEARRRILLAAAALPRARVFGGHAVVNVCPAEEPTKGEAVEDLVGRLRAPGAVYVGDDVTDEDAFASPAVSLSIRVGRSEESAARYFLDGQDDVDALLRALMTARTDHATTRSAKPGGAK